MVPKYFEGLHIGVDAITGTPRIVKMNYSRTLLSDRYKDIGKQEWFSCLLNYFSHSKNKAMVITDKSFVLGAACKNREEVIAVLEEQLRILKNET